MWIFWCDFNGSVKGVSGGIADEIFDGSFGDFKDTVDGSRGVFGKVNGGIWQRCIQPLTIFAKSLILDVRLGSEYDLINWNIDMIWANSFNVKVPIM